MTSVDSSAPCKFRCGSGSNTVPHCGPEKPVSHTHVSSATHDDTVGAVVLPEGSTVSPVPVELVLLHTVPRKLHAARQCVLQLPEVHGQPQPHS